MQRATSGLEEIKLPNFTLAVGPSQWWANMFFGTEYEYIRQKHFQPNTNIFVSGILNIRIFEYLQIFEYSNIFVYIQLDSQAGTT